MAKGTQKIFNAFLGYYRGPVDIDSDQMAVALLSNAITALLPTETNPALGSTNCTEVSAGGNYPSGGINLTMDNTETGGVHTMKLNTGIHTGGVITIAQNAAGPNNVKTALIYDKDAVSPADAAIAYIDLTEDDGVTAVDNSAVDIEIAIGVAGGEAGTILKVQVNNP